ncbi:phosphoenolpyruvate synthase [Roseomonas marmotae]|uniref:Phosphoenolpyruvate synthase n=1 Tax=Roseomonas marmotae TaxID=2768161 RepID=A0ABS3KGF3_9PROT|nr:phosphoenolpyruvate synthase [Roseomonas marmotae]MBO1076556.1 phosphoenolpyruvate synthase [Roseomonas marmotae]QTI81829.1 phosphoenolpyruvate synthase [Roseomonas marmotae]
MATSEMILWFNQVGLGDTARVGGKNASLGELYGRLTPAGLRVPNGFCVTADAYRAALDAANAWPALHTVLDGLDVSDIPALARCSAEARRIVYEATGHAPLRAAILGAYRRLLQECGAGLALAVRSSGTAEDLPNASFAGQHESFLNIRGEEALIEAYRRCCASLFTDRAVVYRLNNGFDHFKVALSVGVMQMVRSDLAASGVIFTLDTESGFRDVVYVTGSYGLGENVVLGKVDPDEFYVHKPTFEAGHRAVLRRALGRKQTKLVYAEAGSAQATVDLPTPAEDQDRFCIGDEEVLSLAKAALIVERHYSAAAGQAVPMDIEWAKDGIDGQLYIVQARPETVGSRRKAGSFESFRLTGTAPVLVTGKSVGERIASGRVRRVRGAGDLAAFQPGEVLVAETTSPDWEPVMKTASAIVTERGGRTCHAAIVARELGVPAVVGAAGAADILADGAEVTVCCARGEVGEVLEGAVPFAVTRVSADDTALPRTQIMLNLANPALAFRSAMLPSAGVGLARMEFIVSEQIRVHPMACIHPEKVASPQERQAIAHLARHHASAEEFFVQTLAEGVGTIAAAFYPRPVILRLSDFKTNEYGQLLGGRGFEPAEENPMLGFRGAARYAHPAYAPAFALECRAIRYVRERLGLTNLRVMVPFCRRLEEAERVLAEMERHGLKRGEGGLEIYVMCEIPNNVILIDRFAALFDGFSIGSNDLTQLTLGVDRDSATVAFDFDERDPGVLEMLRLAVSGARRNHRHIGICGEAPANYPEIAAYLVSLGIEAISVTPASLLRTINVVREAEQRQDAAGAQETAARP